MIVNRNTYVVKPGKMEKALEMLKNIDANNPSFPHYRIYTYNIGPRRFTIVTEIEFENLAEYEEHWKNFAAAPGAAAREEEFFEMLETIGGCEIWNLVEAG